MGLLNKIFGGSWSPGSDRAGTVDHRVTKRRDESPTESKDNAYKSSDVDWQTKENQREAERVNNDGKVNEAADAVDRDRGTGKGTHG